MGTISGGTKDTLETGRQRTPPFSLLRSACDGRVARHTDGAVRAVQSTPNPVLYSVWCKRSPSPSDRRQVAGRGFFPPFQLRPPAGGGGGVDAGPKILGRIDGPATDVVHSEPSRDDGSTKKNKTGQTRICHERVLRGKKGKGRPPPRSSSRHSHHLFSGGRAVLANSVISPRSLPRTGNWDVQYCTVYGVHYCTNHVGGGHRNLVSGARRWAFFAAGMAGFRAPRGRQGLGWSLAGRDRVGLRLA